VALAVSVGCAAGNTYRWQDSNGRTVYSDQPPANGVKYETIGSPNSFNTTPIEPSENAAPTGNSAAGAAASTEGGETHTEKNPELCESAKMRLVALESGRELTIHNAEGEEKRMSPEERELSVQDARAKVTLYCD